ncbi:hypothetical protein TIFTF001_051098 [Ficus carica]|uniref:Uncharacterized protein n=1 Tax=Ficus carica TaxID=3494 RepID=A0AA87Z8P5_FICCA|nr:hypothetical protein TIFTF001_051096 [Ficus carica]GMN21298.1 hypothetical protein TIFTF001_051098 [Ficus carica]
MSCLVESPEDVPVLKEVILPKSMKEEDVAKLFSGMSKFIRATNTPDMDKAMRMLSSSTMVFGRSQHLSSSRNGGGLPGVIASGGIAIVDAFPISSPVSTSEFEFSSPPIRGPARMGF